MDELFQKLPHGDRICELYGNCSCGRDEAILNIKSWVFGEVARLQKVKHAAERLLDTFDEFGNFDYSSEYIDALAAALEENNAHPV